jgi:uncharacterized protein YdhG (YjbR/CyaY superfamily)
MAMDKNNTAATVDEYLDALPEKVQSALQAVRKAIQATAPDSLELISYGIPAYKYKGKPLVYFAAFKNHCSFFGASKALLQSFKKELEPFKTSAGTIQFTIDKPIPTSLVKTLVKARMKDVEEKVTTKKNYNN